TDHLVLAEHVVQHDAAGAAAWDQHGIGALRERRLHEAVRREDDLELPVLAGINPGEVLPLARGLVVDHIPRNVLVVAEIDLHRPRILDEAAATSESDV